MIIVYGIKNCDSVKKALKFFKENNLKIEFFDLKKKQPSNEKIKIWIEKSSINKVFNNKGTTYRILKLKDLDLDEADKFKWLCKETMLVKRPIIEFKNSVIVGFNEEEYKSIFL